MRVLTWLPRRLREELARLDPAHGTGPLPVPPPAHVVPTAEDRDARTRPARRTPRLTGRRPRPTTFWIVAAVAAAVAVVAVGTVVLGRGGTTSDTASGDDVRSSEATPSGPTDAGDGQASAAAAAERWSTFPILARPRPVVLLGPSIVDPTSGFPDGDTKLAYVEGRFHLAASLSSAPAMRDGYALTSADDAVRELRTVPDPGATPGATALEITDVHLSGHGFLTDRGLQFLPAWELHLAGVHDDVYVLAVAPSHRVAVPRSSAGPSDGPSGGQASLSADGRRLTIRFVARHDSTGPCDPGFSSSLQTVQTATAVVLAITVHPEPTAGPSDLACAAVYRDPGWGGPAEPGAPNTRTVTLDEPLGARVVVGADGTPYAVTTG